MEVNIRFSTDVNLEKKFILEAPVFGIRSSVALRN